MKLAIIDDIGIVHVVIKNIEEYDLSKSLVRSEVINETKQIVNVVKELSYSKKKEEV